jgi:hypothetical protein
MPQRLILVLALALAYGVYRVGPVVPSLPVPAPVVASPFPEVTAAVGQLPAGERQALRDSYMILSRAVRSDPDDEPVFADVAAVRRAHRAALLVVWRGVLANKVGEAPGLSAALEGAVESGIGSADVPMNPALREQVAKTFEDVASSIR